MLNIIKILPLAERVLKRGGIFDENTGYFGVKKGVFSVLLSQVAKTNRQIAKFKLNLAGVLEGFAGIRRVKTIGRLVKIRVTNKLTTKLWQ